MQHPFLAVLDTRADIAPAKRVNSLDTPATSSKDAMRRGVLGPRPPFSGADRR